MSLTAGARLGPYEIVAPLGAGGMGEVYRARDTKLDRDVAIKVLPELFISDPERVARFQREAKTLAALNHPHIGGIYGLEDADGVRALVLELVEGPTLADRIAQGPIPLDEALPIARQIAEALEAAHEAGIIHRDLKPANIKLRPDGTVKVLDFGLAKAVEPTPAVSDLTRSPTLSMMATQAGVILGTAAYMSPEQAKGLAADRRSDVFSFGVVLYEMLTGGQPFRGETAPDVLASVLALEPDLASLPAELNPRLVDLVKRCLDKNPKRRWQAIGDVRIDLELVAAAPTVTTALPASRPLWRRAMPALAAAVVASAITGLVIRQNTTRSQTNAAPIRFSVSFPERLTLPTGRPMLAISPDGTHVVLAANAQLYLRSLSETEARPIPGTLSRREVSTPVFSPDGRFIAFDADRTLKRIPITGGTALPICDTGGGLFGMTWQGDALVFGVGPRGKGIMRVSAAGGKPEAIVNVKEDEVTHGPQILPGGRVVLFTVATGIDDDRWDRAKIVVQDLMSGEGKVVVDGGSDARYIPTGHLVYARRGVLFAVPFDAQRLVITGTSLPVVEGVRRSNVATNTGVAHYHFSSSGSLVYIPGSAYLAKALGVVDRKGVVQPLKLPEDAYQSPRVSPDGRHVAVGTDDGTRASIWIHDLSGPGSLRRLTLGQKNRFPIWTADGARVAFQSGDEGDFGIFWQRADGSGTPERLTKAGQGEAHIPDSWSPKGDAFLFTVVKESGASLWIFSLKDRKAVPFGNVESTVWPDAVFSPDGRWVAYVSTVGAGGQGGGNGAIFIQPFPATGTRFQIADGNFPLWSPSGGELLFARPSQQGIFNVSTVTTTPAFTVGPPVVVPRGELVTPRAGARAPRNWDMMADGQHMIGVIDASTQGAPQIQVVLNWFEELKARVPTK